MTWLLLVSLPLSKMRRGRRIQIFGAKILTFEHFLKFVSKSVNWQQKREIIIFVCVFGLCGCSLTKIALLNILNPGQRREGTSSFN